MELIAQINGAVNGFVWGAPMLVLLIGSAVISSFLDNIPFVATMIPILLAMESTGMDVTPLWWAVSLGACLGGNGTHQDCQSSLRGGAQRHRSAQDH